MTARKPVLIKRSQQATSKPASEPAKRPLSDRELREQWQREKARPATGHKGWAQLWR